MNPTPKGVPPLAHLRRTLSRTLRSNPSHARLFILSLLVVSFLLGLLCHISFVHSRILLTRALDSHTPRYHPTSLSLPARPPLNITLISTLFTSSYPISRLVELRLVVLRNLHTPITHYHLLREPDATLPPFFHSLPHISKLSLHTPNSSLTYDTLLHHANTLPPNTVALIANADIYFNPSLLCLTLIPPKTLVALSRHPSPDCPPSSSRGNTGWEPPDFCAGYHPVRAASHDAFAFLTPIPTSVVHAMRHVPVNHFGAENLMLYHAARAGYRVVNPCANVHAFHLHCDAGMRKESAKQRAGNLAESRGEFAGVAEWGWVDVNGWADGRWGIGKGLDCLSWGQIRG